MAAITPSNIKSKFYPSIINREDFSNKPLKARVEKAFNDLENNTYKVKEKIKPNIFTIEGLEGYVVKTTRPVPGIAPDMHLYRVRKALKIQRLIEKYNFGDFIKVPKKFLYYHDRQWHVIAEKLDLSSEAPQINQQQYKTLHETSEEALLMTCPTDAEKELAKAAKKIANNGLLPTAIPISKEQARALTILDFEAGLTDLSLLNMFFTKDRKFAVIDSEPIKRTLQKILKASWFHWIFTDMRLQKTCQCLTGTAKLRGAINDPEVKKVITKTENYYIALSVIKSLAVATFLVLAWIYSPTIIPITLARVIIKTGMVLKFVLLALSNFTFYKVTVWSRNENEASMQLIEALEMRNVL